MLTDMAEIEQLEHYQAALFGFEDTLANSTEADHEALRQAFANQATLTGDFRFGTISNLAYQKVKQLDLSEEESIAWLLAQPLIIEEETDVDDPYIKEIQILKRDAYQTLANRGLPEITTATKFVATANHRLEGKVGIITTTPFRVVKSFLIYNNLLNSIESKRIFPAELTPGEGPAPAAYQLAAQRLGVTSLERLLIVDTQTDTLIAAKRAGATVIGIMNGKNSDELDLLSQDQDSPDYIAEGYDDLRQQLAAPTVADTLRPSHHHGYVG